MSRGEDLELKFSEFLHGKTLPLLISEHFLRSRNCGQIDAACLKRLTSGWEVNLYELKSTLRLSATQKKRLNRSQRLISAIFDAPVKMHVVYGASFSSPWPL